MPDYTIGQEQFVNPYNFIALAQEVERSFQYRKQQHAGTLTGWLDCTLTLKTPIFIPNTSKPVVKMFMKEGKRQDVKEYEFFSYPDPGRVATEALPVIPGSSIRGMIRSAYEAVTNSCLSGMNKTQRLYKRTTQVGKPGRLLSDSNGHWKIQPCRRVGIKIKDIFKKHIIDQHVIYESATIPNLSAIIKNYQEGEAVAITVSTGSYCKVSKKPGKPPKITNLFREVVAIRQGHDPAHKNVFDDACQNFNGYYHKGESFGDKKHHESIFIDDGAAFTIDPQAVENLRENFRLYQNEKINNHFKKGTHKGYQHVGEAESLELRNCLIYYTRHAHNQYYLCPAAIGREVFYNSLESVIDPRFHPCHNIKQLCDACALFGVVGTEPAVPVNDRSAGARVRFTDTTTSPGQYRYDAKIRTLKELASPKLSATEFYLEKPEYATEDIDLWNYDYAGHWQRNQWVDSTQRDAPKIRGRKFYWHHQQFDPTKAYLQSNEIPTERNVRVRPLEQGEFSFRVYFNNLTEEELQKILWVLEIGGSAEHAHKIGMGKPLGLGSVQIRVTKRTLRDVGKCENDQLQVQYTTEEISHTPAYYAGIEKKFVSPMVQEFKVITKYQDAPANVAYPYNEDDPQKKTYQWFVANKKIQCPGTAPRINKSLPTIEERELPTYREI